MKIYDSEDLLLGEYYFFVYNGAVYYGLCAGGYYEHNSDVPTSFMYKTIHGDVGGICNVWEATLIYTL